MIRCALAEIRSARVSTWRRRSSSSSSVSTFGSITTPLPITHSLPGCRIPEGIRWSFHVVPLRTIVCPALFPPWKRTTASARSASRSVTLPLPSSPHWAPTITIPGTCGSLMGALRRPGGSGPVIGAAVVAAPDRDQLAHALQARDDPVADLLLQLGRQQVGGHERRALVLV